MGYRPRYLLRGVVFSSRVRSLGIHEVKIAPRSPWQNPYVERLIGTLRRECLDHTVVLNDAHLRRLLRDYLLYYQVPGPTSLWRRTPQSQGRCSVPAGVASLRRPWPAASIIVTPAGPRKLRPAVSPATLTSAVLGFTSRPGLLLASRRPGRSAKWVRSTQHPPVVGVRGARAPPPTVRGPSMSTRMVKQNRLVHATLLLLALSCTAGTVVVLVTLKATTSVGIQITALAPARKALRCVRGAGRARWAVGRTATAR